MNNLKIFNNNEFGEIRTIQEDNKILFCGSDVAKALGYANPQKAIRDHCKGVNEMDTPTNGGVQKIKYIPEGDLYRLIANSKLPSAEKFECWVFDEVLPTIRKHGMYATDELLNNPDFAILVFQNLKDEREKNNALQLQINQNQQIIGELKPKADYTDRILQSTSLVTITQIAKDYGMSGQELNELLHTLKIQYKQSDQWLLYCDYHDKGFTHSNTIEIPHKDGTTFTKMQTKWTQKGRLFLYELLKGVGVLPTIEQKVRA